MPLRMLRYVDLLVLAAALPVFVAAGLPLFAWGGVAAVWLLQRAVQAFLLRRAEASGNARAAVGLMSVSVIGRIWFIALAVLGIGLADEDAGLPAALLTLVTFQVWFTAHFIGRSTQGRRA
jgi:Na+/pantothenate symporter